MLFVDRYFFHVDDDELKAWKCTHDECKMPGQTKTREETISGCLQEVRQETFALITERSIKDVRFCHDSCFFFPIYF